jgi:hypothetical protein
MLAGRTTFRLMVAVLATASIWYGLSWSDRRKTIGISPEWERLPSLPERTVTLTLERGDWRAVVKREGDHRWRVIEPVEGPAVEGVVDRILNEWSLLERRHPMAFTEMEVRDLDRTRLGLEPAVVRLAAQESTGQKIALRLGGESPLGDGLFAELEGDSAVFLAPTQLLSLVPSTLNALVNRRIWDVEWTLVTRIEIERRGGGFMQLALENGLWRIRKPFSDLADSERVRAWLQSLWAVDADEVLDPETQPDPAAFGLDPATREATISLGTVNRPEEVRLFVGRAGVAGGDRAYLQFSGATTIYAVPSAWLERLNVRVSDFRSRRRVRFDPARLREVVLEQGERRLVLRRSDNGLWQMTEPMQTAADRERMTEFLEGLANLRAFDFLQEPGDSSGQSALLTLSLRQGGDAGTEGVETTRVVRLYAPLPEMEGYRLVGGDEPPALVARQDLEALFGPPPFWRPLWFRDREILSVASSQIRSLTIQRNGQEQTVRREESGRWVGPEGRTIRVEAVEELAGTVGRMRAVGLEPFEEAKATQYGFDPPVLRLEIGLQGDGGIRKILLIGRDSGPGGLRYARVLGQDMVFLLAPELFQFLNRDLLM